MSGEKFALVGMMACGKTTLGNGVASMLSIPFVDSDGEIESRAGMAIAEIFARSGESVFRKMEQEVIGDLLGRPGPLVLALGGGAYVQPSVRDIVRREATAIYLKVEPAEIVRRVASAGVDTRPVLARHRDWRARVETIARERDEAYRLADMVFDAGSNDIPGLVRELALALMASRPSEEETHA